MIDSLIGPATQTGGGAVLTQPSATPAKTPAAASSVANSPPVQALLSGQPPALWASTETPNAGAVFIAENLPSFGELGLGFYRGKDKAVLFNQSMLSPDQVKQLDATGELDALAAPMESFFAGTDSGQGPAGPDAPEPVFGPAGAVPVSAAPAPASTAGVPPAAPGATAMRLEELQPKAPSQRPAPGQGLVLNGLLRRAA